MKIANKDKSLDVDLEGRKYRRLAASFPIEYVTSALASIRIVRSALERLLADGTDGESKHTDIDGGSWV